MTFIELAKKRQSNRTYLNKPVEKEKIIKCVEAARAAPSACNSQPWKFIIVDSPELKSKLAQTTSNKLLPLNHFTNQAPVLVVIINEGSNFTATLGNKIKNRNFSLIDIGIAAEHFCLQATELNLGTCMLGWFKEKEVKNLLNIPEKKRPELIITIGYPADKQRKKKRKKIEQIMSYNKY
ncbi:MAG: nitroreductase family protein [Bacteroidales bacterium]|nr:nitroreductase family protein [Bacteroidales bacterium]